MNSNDFLTFSPSTAPSSILKSVCDNENLMVHQTPIHKNLKVQFQTPARTPLGTIISKEQKKTEKQQTKPTLKGAKPDWHVLKDLDEELKWRERIEVVTKVDHKEYVECAQDFIDDIITAVVEQSSKSADTNQEYKKGKIADSPNIKKVIGVDKNANITVNPLAKDCPKCEDKENTEPKISIADEIDQTPKQRKVLSVTNKTQDTKHLSNTKNQQVDKHLKLPGSGGYNLDNIDIDNFNPFSSSKCLPTSPTQPSSSSTQPAENRLSNVNMTRKHDMSTRDDSISCVDMTADNPFEDSYFNSPMTEIFSSMPKTHIRNSGMNQKNLSSLLTSSPNEMSLCNLDDTVGNTTGVNPIATQEEKTSQIAESKDATNPSSQLEDLDATLTGEEAKEQLSNVKGQSIDLEHKQPEVNNGQVESSNEMPKADEMNFVSAESLMQNGFDFDLDYLANKGEGVVIPDLHKHSLYLKFDPLVSREDQLNRLSMLMGRRSDIIDLCGRLSLSRKNLPLPTMTEETESKQAPDFLCDSPSKFMREMDTESQGSEGRCSTLSDADSNEEIIEVLRYSETEMRRLIEECREPLVAKINESSLHMEKLQSDNEKLLEILKDHEETTSSIVIQQQMEEQRNKCVVDMLEKDKDELKNHLESIEKAYMELLKRMEQMKSTLTTCKNSEQTYKKVIEDYKSNLGTSQKRYKALKETMEEREQKLVDQHQQKEQEMASQISGLKARCKYMENQSKSLKLQVEQTTNENKELSKICDELIEQQTGKR